MRAEDRTTWRVTRDGETNSPRRGAPEGVFTSNTYYFISRYLVKNTINVTKMK